MARLGERLARRNMTELPPFVFKAVNAVHRTVFDVSKGRLLGTMIGMPVVKLTTTGRKSGEPRTSMLTAPVHDGDTVVLVASKGGSPAHPAWYLNLQADPEVVAVVGGRRRTMLARTASDEERAALWPRIVEANPGYAGYQEKTERQIPVVILEPKP